MGNHWGGKSKVGRETTIGEERLGWGSTGRKEGSGEGNHHLGGEAGEGTSGGVDATEGEKKNSKVSKVSREGWRGEGVRSSIRLQLGTGEGRTLEARSWGGRWGPARLVGELGSMGRMRKLGRNLNYQKAVR